MGGRREYLQEPWSALLEAISEIVVAIALENFMPSHGGVSKGLRRAHLYTASRELKRPGGEPFHGPTRLSGFRNAHSLGEPIH